MNVKLWINKALSTCLMVAIIATYSMVALANSEKIVGELFVNGTETNGENAAVMINGEIAISGGSVFSDSTIATPEDAGAIISLGKTGKIELAPSSTMALSFNEKGISGNLAAGRITVLKASNDVAVKTTDGNTVKLKTGESVSAEDGAANSNGGAQTNNGHPNHGTVVLYALILGGAIAGLIYAVTRSNHKVLLGGGVTVVSTTR